MGTTANQKKLFLNLRKAKGRISALEAGDLVLLGDILDYEFSDLTDIWHDMLMQLANQFEPQE